MFEMFHDPSVPFAERRIIDMKNTFFYTSTSADLPYKAIFDYDLYNTLKGGKIIPVHLQLSVTNKCNLNCDFCSFRGRDKHLSLDIDTLKDIVKKFINLGTKAITITGGGEPLCYENINKFLIFCTTMDIKVGLVTNGLLLSNLSPEASKAITWCRISLADSRSDDELKILESILPTVVSNNKHIFWSFSYVVLEKQNHKLQLRAINLAKSLKFGNIRFVRDQENQDTIDLQETKLYIQEKSVLDLCVFDSKDYVGHIGACRVYLLRPFVAADGYIYPCCTLQYNVEGSDFTDDQKICYYAEFNEFIESQKSYKASCQKCFSNHYNNYLEVALNPILFKEWV